MTHQCKLIGFGAALTVATTVLIAGCGGDLPVASRLERTRVLGARVQVASDPGRAEAQPGETATVEWLVTGPRASGPLAWTFSLCAAIDGACDGAPGMTASGTAAPVIVPFVAPATIDPIRRPLMLGALCEGGAPTVDDDGPPRCGPGTTSANPARFQIPLSVAGQPANHHPRLDDDVIEWDGVAWTARASGDAGSSCDAGSGMPTVVANDVEHHLRVITDGNDREAYARTTGAVPELEGLQLSSFATSGELERQYAAVDATDTRPDAELADKWTAPAAKDVPVDGLTVQFHFVLRDGRGGLDWTDRALCVLAP